MAGTRQSRLNSLLLLGVLFFTSIYVVRIGEDMVDFEVNYKAGQRLRAGENLYQTGDGHFMFKYLPFSSLLYAPLSYLPLEAAKPVWYSLTVLCSFFLFSLSHRLVAPGHHPSWGLRVLPPLILAKFFFREVSLGQINTLVTSVLLVMAAVLTDPRWERTRRETGAGALWGLATALKPYALLFLPYFAVKGLWRGLLAGAGTITLALALPSLFYGFPRNLEVLEAWAATLSRSTPALLSSGDNVSIVAFWMKWTGLETLSLWLTGVIVCGLALMALAVVARGRGIDRAEVLECALLLTFIPLVSPLGWDYTLLMSILGVTLLVRRFRELPRFWRPVLVANFCIIALVVYDLVGRTFYFSFMGWSVTTVNFLIVIAALAHLRFRGVC